MRDHTSTDRELARVVVKEALARNEQERLDHCGRELVMADVIGDDVPEELEVMLLAGSDLEHVEEYRRAVRDYDYFDREESWAN